MATADQVVGLVKSHVDGDDERLYTIALQIAAAEAKRGRDARAAELRDLIDEARTSRPGRPSGRPRSVAAPASLGVRGRTRLDSLAVVSEPNPSLSSSWLRATPAVTADIRSADPNRRK